MSAEIRVTHTWNLLGLLGTVLLLWKIDGRYAPPSWTVVMMPLIVSIATAILIAITRVLAAKTGGKS